MFLSHHWYYLFGYCIFLGNLFLMVLMTISYARPFDLYESHWNSEDG